MLVYSGQITVSSNKKIEVIDITGRVGKIVRDSGVRSGMAFITTQHTTAAVCINEPCAELQKDVVAFLGNFVEGVRCRHDEKALDGRANGLAHLMAYLLPRSESLQVNNGMLNLGTWQAVFFIELDGPREGRKIDIRVMGI